MSAMRETLEMLVEVRERAWQERVRAEAEYRAACEALQAAEIAKTRTSLPYLLAQDFLSNVDSLMRRYGDAVAQDEAGEP